MPAVVRVSSPVVTTRVVSSPYSYGYNYRYPYSYGYGYNYPYSYGYNYPYSYSSAYNYGYGYPLYNSVYSAPIYQAPIYAAAATPTTIVVAPPPASSTTYGTCQATPSGVTSNSCAPGKVPISVAGQGCICADPTTGMGGCGNVLNGVCK